MRLPELQRALDVESVPGSRLSAFPLYLRPPRRNREPAAPRFVSKRANLIGRERRTKVLTSTYKSEWIQFSAQTASGLFIETPPPPS